MKQGQLWCVCLFACLISVSLAQNFSRPTLTGDPVEYLFEQFRVKQLYVTMTQGHWPQGEGTLRLYDPEQGEFVGETANVEVNLKRTEVFAGDKHNVKMTILGDRWFDQQMISISVGDGTGLTDECLTWMGQILAKDVLQIPFPLSRATFVEVYVNEGLNGLYCMIEKEDEAWMENRGFKPHGTPGGDAWLSKSSSDIRFGDSITTSENFQIIKGFYCPRTIDDPIDYITMENTVNMRSLLTYAALSLFFGIEDDMWFAGCSTHDESWYVEQVGQKRIYFLNDPDVTMKDFHLTANPYLKAKKSGGHKEPVPNNLQDLLLNNFKFRTLFNTIVKELFDVDGAMSPTVIGNFIDSWNTDQLKECFRRDTYALRSKDMNAHKDWMMTRANNIVQYVDANTPPPRPDFMVENPMI